MNGFMFAMAAIAVLIASACFAQEARRVEPFDAAWRFARFGVLPDGTTAPEPQGLEAPDFDDAAWRQLDLPHDFGIEGPFDINRPGNTGKLPWDGIAWYRKTFAIEGGASDSRYYLDIDGAMSRPKIYCNGQLAGEWRYGYTSFRIDLTPFVREGRNVLAIRLDNPPQSSRWYPGGGIYRHVRLVKTPAIHVAHHGVFVRTPSIDPDRALAKATVEVQNHTSRPQDVTVRCSVGDQQATSSLTVAAGAVGSADLDLSISSPRRWDLDDRHLYQLKTEVLVDGKPVDEVIDSFGVRAIEWTANDGFHLNGRRVQLNGVCMHHDLGALGTAVNRRALERQLEILKQMGANAIRTSHNPPAPELIELCDLMGFLVLDEAFDTWTRTKTRNDYGNDFEQWHERDIANLVRRDRNHPSVVAWSSGNEIAEQTMLDRHDVSERLTALIKKHDPTRLVAVGCNRSESGRNGFQKTMDLFGYNYKPQLYDDFRAANPDQPIIGSETASTLSTRGEYFFPVDWQKDKGFFNFHVSSYDLYAPRWSTRPDLEFEGLDRNPFVAGEFVWTGFDYLGEPTPYNRDATVLLNANSDAERRALAESMQKLGGKTPARSSYFGIVDLAGLPKDRFYLYQSRWRPDLPVAHILPHWNWPDRSGQDTPVHVYANGDEAELFLNGKSLGRKKRQPFEYRLVWNEVAYEPGELRVETWKDGKPWAKASRRTTGPATRIVAEADRSVIAVGGRDLSFITVRLVDDAGLTVPTAKNRLRFRVDGAATYVAADNGDPTDLETFSTDTRKALNGMCVVIVKSNKSGPGAATIHVSAESLTPATVKIETR